MRRHASLLAIGLAIWAILGPGTSMVGGAAGPITIRLATIAPKGSSYERLLLEMGDKWRKASDGQVELKVYAGGTQGSEGETVQRMNNKVLQAGLLSVGGLGEIDGGVAALQEIPMLYRSLDEVEYVREKMRPELEKRLLARGYVPLFWGDSGWVRFFSRKAATRPDDFKSMKIFVTASGSTAESEIMQALGYKPVMLAWTDALIQLKTNGIDALPVIPVLALSGQYFTVTRHMVEVNWAPIVGAAVITKSAWEAIPRATRDILMPIAVETGKKIQVEGRKENDTAVQAMRTLGLEVHPLTPELDQEWRTFAEAVYPKVRGGLVPADMFDQARQLVTEYRNSHMAGGAAGPITIKLATIAPKGSSYERLLLEMGDKWRKASDGQVELKLDPGSTQGGEPETVQRMNNKVLQAGLLTMGGLGEIDGGVAALEKIPMLYRSLDEVEYVREKMRPELEKRLLARGYVPLFWGDSGWVRFFSRKAATRPSDFKSMNIFVTASGSTAESEIMQALGYKPVTLALTDVLTQLKTGGIDALPVIPVLALSGQYFTVTRHMVEVNWAPIVGAAVITKSAWEAIPRATRDLLMPIAVETGKKIQAERRKENDAAVQAMRTLGLEVHPLTPQLDREWRTFAEGVYPKVRGGLVPADMFDRAQQIVKEYRANPPGVKK